MERIGAADGVGAVRGDLIGDPLRGVGGDVSDCGAAGFTQRGEERFEGLAVPTGGGPDQAAGVVVDRDRDVPVALLVADLINPDPPQTRQRVTGRDAVGNDPGDDRSDGAPGDPQQQLQRRLRGAGRHPGDGVLEHQRVPGVVPRPRHRRDHDPVLRAGHPRRASLQKCPIQPEVRRAPLPAALALVIARAAPLTAPAPPLRALAGPDREDRHLVLVVELDAVDHSRSLDPEHACPYRAVAHAVPRSVVLDFDTQNLSRNGVLLVHAVSKHPRKRPESHFSRRRPRPANARIAKVTRSSTLQRCLARQETTSRLAATKPPCGRCGC